MATADGTGQLTPQVFLRPIGVPLPLGMSGLVIASFIDSGLELHWVPAAKASQIGVILIAVPFVLQLITCVLAYLARDGAAGAVLGSLAATWLAIGLIHVTSPGPSTSASLGLLLLVAGATVAMSSVAVSTSRPLPAAVFVLAAVRFELSGIYQLSGTTVWEHAAGILGLVIAAGAAYCAVAFELEAQGHGIALPTFRRRSVGSLGALAGQLRELAQEPGVHPPS